jgi:hypothetical protein
MASLRLTNGKRGAVVRVRGGCAVRLGLWRLSQLWVGGGAAMQANSAPRFQVAGRQLGALPQKVVRDLQQCERLAAVSQRNETKEE